MGKISVFGKPLSMKPPLKPASSPWVCTIPDLSGWYAVVHVLGEGDVFPSAAFLSGGKWDCDASTLRAFHGPYDDKLAALKWAYEHEPSSVEIELLGR